MNMAELVGEKNIAAGKYWGKGLTLVKGCTPVSEGCENCWAAAMSHKFGAEYPAGGRESGMGVTDKNGKWRPIIGVNWNNRHWLLRRAQSRRKNRLKPKVISIWNDLFHPGHDNQYIGDIMSILCGCPDIFLILTKRPERIAQVMMLSARHKFAFEHAAATNRVWLGVSVENQKYIHRIDQLMQAWPGKKFVSVEPCLGKVDLGDYLDLDGYSGQSEIWRLPFREPVTSGLDCAIDWVVLGGETSPHARPMHPDWPRSVRDQCIEASVPFFFKHWGEWAPERDPTERERIGLPRMIQIDGHYCGHGGILMQGHQYCRRMQKYGRKKAGRELDGRVWDQMPELDLKIRR